MSAGTPHCRGFSLSLNNIDVFTVSGFTGVRKDPIVKEDNNY